MIISLFFFFKQKTAYEMRISDWSSDVCSSDLRRQFDRVGRLLHNPGLCFFAAALSTISHRLEEFRHRAAAHPKPAAIWMPRHIGIRSSRDRVPCRLRRCSAPYVSLINYPENLRHEERGFGQLGNEPGVERGCMSG